MNRTNIPWCDYIWNPFTGCIFGCDYCYARRVYERFGNDFTPQIHPDRLNQPEGLWKPSVIFCGSTGDPADCPPEFLEEVFKVMNQTRQHQYMMLTKRPMDLLCNLGNGNGGIGDFMPPNLWLGVTVTNQKDANENIPELLGSNACHRFVSVEPMLGPVDLSRWVYRLDYVILGAKSPGKQLHRGELRFEWENLLAQVRKAGTPVMYKHAGSILPVVEWIYPDSKAATKRSEKVIYDANPVRDLLEVHK